MWFLTMKKQSKQQKKVESKKDLPNQIVLLGEVYTIEEVEKIEGYGPERHILNTDLYGLIIPEKKTIMIRIDLDYNSKIRILFHELGHYFAYYYGLDTSETFAEAFTKYVITINDQLGLYK